ncbi:Protein C44B12.6 [Aphelenchoides avenae]|nr:Protein C44B12.6 [Aphelenchus avenae]
MLVACPTWLGYFLTLRLCTCLPHTPSQRDHAAEALTKRSMKRYRRASSSTCQQQFLKHIDAKPAILSLFAVNPDGTSPQNLSAIPRQTVICTDEHLVRPITPDMPLKDRALCPFVQVENRDPRRIPERIPEIKCLCVHPLSGRSVLNDVQCIPMYYNVPVLLFDEGCSKPQMKTQRIAFACVPAIAPQVSQDLDIYITRPELPLLDV